MRIDMAFNIISAFSFTSLLVLIFYVGKTLFNSSFAGFVAVLSLLFNSSLSFVNFIFSKHAGNVFSAWWHNVFYHSAGPLGQNTISVYWTLNTYLNQRHLIFGIAVGLLFFLETI